MTCASRVQNLPSEDPGLTLSPEFFVLVTSKVISGWETTCYSAHTWMRYSTVVRDAMVESVEHRPHVREIGSSVSG